MGRKFVEHPLIVAVALGLLAPLALPNDDDEEGLPTYDVIQNVDVEEPSVEEFARVEDLWHQVRTKV